MNYFIKRSEQEFGPYSLADVQRYVASGHIALNDLARSEGMTDWLPVSAVVGSIPMPAAPTAKVGPQPIPGEQYPSPPGLHWVVVLLLGICTCGLFGWVWALVEAAWVRQIQPKSKALFLYLAAVGVLIIATVFRVQREVTIAPFLQIAGAIIWLFASFNMRNTLEEHYNTEEPIGLSLSGVMTFFFNIYYFQYHFNEIKRAKEQLALNNRMA
jgi:hypothetical protein